MATVFLSSTARDLGECRDAAYKAIEGLQGYHCVRMEDFGSWDQEPDAFCRQKVGESDVVICLAGPLYGSLTRKGPSYTEREYDAAKAKKKPCLVFVTDEDFLLPANLFESETMRKRQQAFRKKATNGRIAVRFSGAKDIGIKVVQALRNWEATPTTMAEQTKLLNSQIQSVSYRIAIINQSTAAPDDEVAQVVKDLQTQVHRDFAPAWGVDADLSFVPSGAKPPASSWWLVIRDKTDQEGALGYRTLNDEGLPLTKVFVQSAKDAGASWTVSASHVLLEMLANPRQNINIPRGNNPNKSTLYAQEVCNACAAEKYAYQVEKTMVSDFVFPSWFESFRKPNSTRFDFGNHITSPFGVLEGGYAFVWDVTSETGWHTTLGTNRPQNPRARKRR
jgi:Domain of unknown function (DUF4062)